MVLFYIIVLLLTFVFREAYRRTRLSVSGSIVASSIDMQSILEGGEPERPEWKPFDKVAEEKAIMQRYHDMFNTYDHQSCLLLLYY